MRILGIIPARGGSKGIPGKNIKPLGGKPLLEYTFESAEKATSLTKVILSSDDKKIISLAQKIGLEAPFIRPDFLAEDTTPSIEVILDALEFFKSKGIVFDAVCLLQPTTPFRQNNIIDIAVKKFVQEKYDSLISVREVPHHYNPHWCFEERNGMLKIATGDEKIIPRRQDLPKAYHRDGSIYITKTEVVVKQKSLFGHSIGYIDTTNFPYVNLDNLSDWEEAERMLK